MINPDAAYKNLHRHSIKKKQETEDVIMKTENLKNGLLTLVIVLLASTVSFADGTENSKAKKSSQPEIEIMDVNILEFELEQVFDLLEAIVPDLAMFPFENELQIEHWMKNPLPMNNNAFEAELSIEQWMLSGEHLNKMNSTIIEQELPIEPWMVQPLANNSVSSIEQELPIEDWMLISL